MGRLISSGGSTKRTMAFLTKMETADFTGSLASIAQRGVAALQAATPVDSGLTAASWSYEIKKTRSTIEITWINSNTVNGVNIAVILQYGHGTGTGGFVAGRDYINGALKPVFDAIAEDVWKKVTSV